MPVAQAFPLLQLWIRPETLAAGRARAVGGDAANQGVMLDGASSARYTRHIMHDAYSQGRGVVASPPARGLDGGHTADRPPVACYIVSLHGGPLCHGEDVPGWQHAGAL